MQCITYITTMYNLIILLAGIRLVVQQFREPNVTSSFYCTCKFRPLFNVRSLALYTIRAYIQNALALLAHKNTPSQSKCCQYSTIEKLYLFKLYFTIILSQISKFLSTVAMTTEEEPLVAAQPLVVFEFQPEARRACVEWLLSRLSAKDYRGGAELEVTPLNREVRADLQRSWLVGEHCASYMHAFLLFTMQVTYKICVIYAYRRFIRENIFCGSLYFICSSSI